MKSCLQNTLCFATLWVTSLSCFAPATAQDVGGVASTVTVSDWVVHPSSGRVFASILDGDQIIEYSTSGEVRRFSVGSNPDELLIKGDQLIAGCSKSPSLHVVDLKTNQSKGVVKLSGKGPYALFCSKANDNYVYCICNPGTAWWDGQVFQVDMRTMKVRSQVKVQPWGQSHPMHVAMSADGKWIVPDARGQSSPSGADLMKVDSETLTFTQVRDYHSSFGPITAGPLNRFWTLGSHLYTLDLTKKLRSFTGRTCAIHPKYDLVASLTGSSLILERLSDREPIGRATIEFAKTATQAKTRRSQQRNQFDPTVAFDLQNNRVFVGHQNGGDWVDLSAFESELRPLKMIVAPSSTTTLVGKPLRVPVGVTNSDGGISFFVKDGPDGARFEKGSFTWTPTAEDLGVNYFDLAIRDAKGAQLDETQLKVEVTVPKVELGFLVRSMKLSPNGQRMVAWGAGKGQENRHPAHTGPDSIAVIDIKTAKVLASKELPQGVRDVAIDDRYVFIALASGNVLYRVDHQLSSSKRQFLQGQPQFVKKVSPTVLAIGEERTFEFFDAEKMVPVRNGLPNNLHPSTVSRFGAGKTVTMNGRVTDRESGELLRIVSSTLPNLATGRARNVSFHQHNQGATPAWGRKMSFNGMLSNHKGTRIAQPSNVSLATISEDYPVGILIASENEGQISKKVLKFCSLIDGTILQTSTIKEYSTRQPHQHSYGNQNLLIADGKQVFIALRNEIHLAGIPDAIIQSAPMPTHFLSKQKLSLPVGKTERISLAVGGETKGTTFALMHEYEGIRLQEDSGVIEVDTTKLWDTFSKQATSPDAAYRQAFNRSGGFNAAAIEEQYRLVTGKEMPEGKLAAQLPIHVSLRDAEGQEDVIQFAVVLIGTREPIDAAMKRIAEQREKAQAEARKRQEEMMQAREAARAAAVANQGKASGEGVSERLDKLEAKIRRIEAALDLVLKKLEEK